MKHLESFGSVNHYSKLIRLVENWNGRPNVWRKVANMLNTIRRDLREWPHVDKSNQRREVISYINKALIDTKFPDAVKIALVEGINSEFNFGIQIPTLDNPSQPTTL